MPWQIDVYSPDGATLRRVLTPDDPVDNFGWNLRGDGDCLEGYITGRGLDLRAREIVAVRTREHPDAGPLVLRYIGWVVQVPAARAPGFTTTRLMGGRRRLEELLNRAYRLPPNLTSGTDVAHFAGETTGVLAGASNPAGPRLIRGSSLNISQTYPPTGFDGGERYPLYETMAESLESLAAMVPGFTVEPSSSYTYRGDPTWWGPAITFQPGEQVPPVMWGTRVSDHATLGPRAVVFFERPDPRPRALDELGDQLAIEWLPRESELVVDDVTVVVMEGHNADSVSVSSGGVEYPANAANLCPPVVHRVQLGGAVYGAQLRVGAEGQGLKASSWSGGHSAAGWNNPGNAFDGNPASYASNQAVWPFTLARPAAPAALMFRVRYSSFVPIKVEVERTVGLVFSHHWTLGSTNGKQVDSYLQVPPHWPPGQFSYPVGAPTIRISADEGTYTADQVRVYEVTPYELDPAVLNRLALAHMRLPGNAPAAAVTVPNRHLAPAWRWQLALANGEQVTGAAQQIEYRVTRDEGFTTRLHLEQALTPSETAARALLDTRIRQAVRAGTKPTA